jgi:hypothetical protein
MEQGLAYTSVALRSHSRSDLWAAALKENGQMTLLRSLSSEGRGISRRKDFKILRLEYTSVALRSHSRSVIAGVPQEVSKLP